MTRLVVCCDGTWNTPEQEENGIPAPTNVFKIFNAIADKDHDSLVEQKKYYNPGVGSSGGLLGSVLGGAVGLGISRNIQSAYHWLANNYEEGDEVYIFGFSRGAFAARSLGGLLSRGLLNLRSIPSIDSWKRVKKAYKGYRSKKGRIEDWADGDWEFFNLGQALPITFIGVWETVGALGVPDDLEFINFFEKKKNWSFHNIELNSNVKVARHAMAMDEKRSSFTICRWNNTKNNQSDLKEVWFPGVHSDVGGGYADCELSNAALLWMIEEVQKVGLWFKPGIQGQIQSNPLGVMHNSFKGGFAKLRSRPRNINAMIPANETLFHESAIKRQEVSPIEHVPYHPTKVLAVGESYTVEIFADTRWNYTGIFLQENQNYTFASTGEWQDSKDACDWEGTEDGKLTPGDIMRATGSFVGGFEKVFKVMSKNESTDFLGTKRIEKLDWFTLVGCIANDSGAKKSVKNDGTPVVHQSVALASHKLTPLKIKNPGYLYCFPNDVWTLYGNNHGSVHLTVTRTA